MDAALIQIPSLEKCREMFNEYQMLPNIQEHSEVVMQLAKTITDNLSVNCPVNRELCLAAALLHDITKTESFKTGEAHAESGGRLLKSLGYPEIADIVAQHVTLRHFSHDAPLNEAEIVYYADKRVKHNEVVSVEERIIDLLERYGTTEAQRRRILRMKDTVIDIEVKLDRCLESPLDELIISL